MGASGRISVRQDDCQRSQAELRSVTAMEYVNEFMNPKMNGREIEPKKKKESTLGKTGE